MNFRTKSLIQWVISILPYSHVLNRFMQIHVSRSLPIKDSELDARKDIAYQHLKGYFDVHGKWPTNILDIGAGSDLALPILLAAEGSAVTASDINRLATKALVDDILCRTGHTSLEESNVTYVVYSPPLLPFSDGEFDLITSTSVLEHVPADQLPILLSELRRVLKPDGICSHHIAHKDHWSDTDPSLHSMNYVQYDAVQWARFNPPVMFQNRVLHGEYSALFAAAGFRFDVTTTVCNTPPAVVAPQFSRFSADDLVTTHSWYTCRIAS